MIIIHDKYGSRVRESILPVRMALLTLRLAQIPEDLQESLHLICRDRPMRLNEEAQVAEKATPAKTMRG